jgi:NADH dehydrogenase
MASSNEAQNLRRITVLLRVVLGIIFIVTWWENLNKGLYQADNFAGFIRGLAEGHPLTWYGSFLTGVIAPNAAIFSTFQLITELGMGIAFILGLFTPLAGLGATFFFLNLLLSYLNPNTGEWIWTYVLLVTVALAVALARSGRALGVDGILLKNRGKPPFFLLW